MLRTLVEARGVAKPYNAQDSSLQQTKKSSLPNAQVKKP